MDCVQPELPSSKMESLQQDFSQHIRTQESKESLSDIEDRRLGIYRELFFNNVEGFAAGAFPVLKELFSEEQWLELVRDFFIKHSCSSPYFLEISEEFLAYIETSELAFLPDFAYQLAHWEWMELYADVYEEQTEAFYSAELSGSGSDLESTCFTKAETTWPAAYDYPVHKISKDFMPNEKQNSFFIVYRNPELEVGFLEINPLSYVLFEQITENPAKTLKEILSDISHSNNMDAEQVLAGGKDIIKQWLALGIVNHSA